MTIAAIPRSGPFFSLRFTFFDMGMLFCCSSCDCCGYMSTRKGHQEKGQKGTSQGVSCNSQTQFADTQIRDAIHISYTRLGTVY